MSALRRRHVHVVADYREAPAEGIQVVAKTLVDGLRARDWDVTVIAPGRLFRALPGLVSSRPEVLVFVHGPGDGVVKASLLLRRLTRAHIVWVATRPDLADVPAWARGRRTAHAVVCNRRRADLDAVAPGAVVREQFIGIDPARLVSHDAADPWSTLRSMGVPIALHVGHLRRNRGLDLLVEAKQRLGDRVEIVVQGSPTFEPDPGVIEELTAAGITVRREYVPNLADLYRAADLYLFPARPELSGAIELPLGVLEALACRRPVLANDFGALRAAVGGVRGVRLTSPSTFVADLEALLDDPVALKEAAAGLPDELHAERVTDAVADLVTTEVR